MIDYQTNFNTDAVAFPSTQAINVSVPGAGDGTELKALLINDIWGARQAIMTAAGLTPNGSSESFANSQFYTALLYTCIPVGTIIMSHSNNLPTTLGYRFIVLNGQGLLRSLYADLDAACYVGDPLNGTADNWYHANDALGVSRNPTGNYLITANMRGVVPRGDDPSGIRDPDGPTRIFPDFQNYAMQTHIHEVDTLTNSWNADAVRQLDNGSTFTGFEARAAASGTVLRANENITKVGSGPTVLHNEDETRMANVQVKFWVRY